MTYAEYIQIGIGIVLAATFGAIAWQLVLQNRLLQVQILNHRFEGFFRTGATISDGQIEQIHLWPDNYMTSELYSKYKDDPRALRKYLGALHLYTYLAFAYTLKRLKLPDPLGYEWTERWAADLCSHPEFLQCHDYLRAYYPHFAEYVDTASRAQTAKTVTGAV